MYNFADTLTKGNTVSPKMQVFSCFFSIENKKDIHFTLLSKGGRVL